MNELKKYSCNICGKEYKHRQSLRNHMKLKHLEKDATFPTFSKPNTTQIQPEIQHNTTK